MKNYDEAIASLEKAKALFPEDASAQGPYWILAQVYKAKGNPRSEATELTAMTLRNEDHIGANIELANVLEQLGDSAGAAAALDRAMYISPYDPAQHVRLATLFARTGNKRGAVRERQAVVALNPVDRAEALYQLALAYYEAGDGQAARRGCCERSRTRRTSRRQEPCCDCSGRTAREGRRKRAAIRIKRRFVAIALIGAAAVTLSPSRASWWAASRRKATRPATAA